MHKQSFKTWLIGVLLTVLTTVPTLSTPTLAEEFGGTEPGKWMLGFRVGFAPLTQQLSDNTSTSIGPLVNFQGLYSLNT